MSYFIPDPYINSSADYFGSTIRTLLTITSGSTSASVSDASGINAGDFVTCYGVPTGASGTYIVSIAGTTLTLSAAATDSGTYSAQFVTKVRTWNKPLNARIINVKMYGSGGGGASGAKGLNNVARSGGGGAGSGGVVDVWMDASRFGSSETVTIGLGGTGGLGRSTNSTAGQAGANGLDCTVTVTNGTLLRCIGGGSGGAGPIGGVAGTNGGGPQGGNSGGSASATQGSGASGGPSNIQSTCTQASGGGGAGGSITSGNISSSGGSGGRYPMLSFTGGGGGTGAGTNGADGVSFSGNPYLDKIIGASGGGGGGSSISVNAGNGGNGGWPGGGGGGGGASTDSVGTSGGGGCGGNGLVVITSYW